MPNYIYLFISKSCTKIINFINRKIGVLKVKIVDYPLIYNFLINNS